VDDDAQARRNPVSLSTIAPRGESERRAALRRAPDQLRLLG